MADDADLLMDMLKNFVSFGQDQALSTIFGDPDNLPNIENAIRLDVEKAFWQQSADDALITAGSYLSAAQQFFAINYQNATNEAQKAIAQASDKSAETINQNEILYGLLDLSSTSPALFNLTVQAENLETWIENAAAGDPSGKTAATAATIYLGLYLHICLTYNERRKVAPSASVAATEGDNMRDNARVAITTMLPQVVALVQTRL